jgi:hypothetical protein
VIVGAMNENPARFVRTIRAWSAEPGRRGKNAGAHNARDHLEVSALGDRRLVDVPAEDQLGTGGGEAP